MSQGSGAGRLVAGRYRLAGPLGEGGMGVVWRARDEVLGREVAVKEVRAPAGLGGADVRRLYARLEREAWATARVAHRNVVTVHDVAAEDGRPWIVMELVRGLTLAETLEAEGPMPPRRAAHIGAEILAALRAAHAAGVLHRDVKPGNVLLGNDGRVVLTDFGIAAVAGTPHLTMTGELVGSPEFLAPERALGRTPGPASDLWSLGVLLYAAVEGGTPFRRDTALSTLRAVVDDALPPPRRAGALTPVVEGLLRKEPDERLSADETERLLHLVSAGGAPVADPPPPGPDPRPAAPAGQAGAESPAGGPVAGGTVPGGTVRTAGGVVTATADPEPGRPRRRPGAVIAAGAALSLLTAGTLAYVLLRDGGAGDRSGDGVEGAGGRVVPAASTAGTPGPTSGSTGGGGADGKGGGGGGGNGAGTGTGYGESGAGGATLEQSVRVRLAALRDAYSGTCPMPGDRAPSFTAVITVGRVPASVHYRWATESGETSDSAWKTAEFGSAYGEAGMAARQRRVEHTELAYDEGSMRRDRVRLEIRSPVHVHSEWVGFSVTCQEETPSGGGSPYPDGSVTPRS
ncbi:serine/threonine-protein kinase [Streptomyces sp. NPDC047928]|uniref:serine/threonine-protein kinase n=1 Tax=unclassified Streptomyces TaxID=2593676 RepID=UPI003711294A